MNLSVNVNINAAPELVGVLQALTAALTGAKQIQVETLQPVQTAPVTPVTPVTPATPTSPVTPEPAPVTPQTMQLPAYQPLVSQPQQPQQPTGVPVAQAPQYTLEQLGVAAGPLLDAGRGPELLAWLQSKGAQALTFLDKSFYGEFALFLRSLGAKI